MASIIIVGGGGFSLEVHEYLLDAMEAGRGLVSEGSRLEAGPDDILGYLDAGTGLGERYARTLRNLGDPAAHTPIADACYLTAIGDCGARARLWRSLSEKGARFLTLVHPSARLARTSRLGAGALVCPFGIVGPDADVGADVVVNIYASINHEAKVGPHSVLSPYASVMGRGAMGEQAFLGSAAIVAPGAALGDRAKLGAGSIIFERSPADCLVVGTPAQVRKIYPKPADADG